LLACALPLAPPVAVRRSLRTLTRGMATATAAPAPSPSPPAPPPGRPPLGRPGAGNLGLAAVFAGGIGVLATWVWNQVSSSRPPAAPSVAAASASARTPSSLPSKEPVYSGVCACVRACVRACVCVCGAVSGLGCSQVDLGLALSASDHPSGIASHHTRHSIPPSQLAWASVADGCRADIHWQALTSACWDRRSAAPNPLCPPSSTPACPHQTMCRQRPRAQIRDRLPL
jgi:hypothetical protein